MLTKLCFAALVGASLIGAPALAQDNGHAEVSANVKHDTLKSLRHATPAPYVPRHEYEHKYPSLYAPPGQVDGALQTTAVTSVLAPVNLWSFAGIGNDYHPEVITGTPPDTVGAVGATQYVQVVNGGIVVFDKTTRLAVYGPVLVNTLWSGFGGDCQNRNDGDGVVVYDKAADRWIVSQFAVPTNTGPSLECVAVSQTSDATGGWYRYAFSYTKMDDYPKMGVWPDAYYVTFNMFGSTYVGANMCAYDRHAMLTGAAATQHCFQQTSAIFGILPADLDGSLPPPANAPNYLMSFGTNSLKLWKFHVDWAVPANTTLTGPTSIPVAAFTAACSGGGTCIPQPGGNLLDSLADRLMFRLAYRNFGDHEALLVNHTVNVSGIAAPRWYEIRNPNGTPSVFQQGTYAPADGSYRWMGSIAMDRRGDVALGYSVSSSTLKPAIRYTGRLVGDPLGTLQAETSIVEGTGTATVDSRWGDYSAMTIDPVDDCTFWYTTEYYDTTGEFTWSTRVASLFFPGCQRRYVNSGLAPGGIHDGKSWSTAYLDLQSALADTACCEVWVAAGLYKPTATADRTISFGIRPGTAMYGGFAGNETKLSQRDPSANPTVLSGDIDNNDTGQNGIDGDTTQIVGSNSYHVVVMDGTTAAGPVTASTILDGFTITGGAANGAAPNDSGGGLLCDGSGAGHACNATLSNLHFAGNFSTNLGGALYNNGSGGDSSPLIRATTFSGNQSANGGAAFQDTNAGTTGPTYVNDTFVGNSAGYGAAMYNRITSATGAVTLTSVTASGNASGGGGAVAEYCVVGGSPTFALTNVILWGDTGPSGSEEVLVANCALLPTFKNSVVMGSGGSANWQSVFGIDAGGNLDVNPLLGQLQDNGGSTSTMLPGAGSPAIDAGLDSACKAAPVNANDQRGAARTIGVHCDIGSVEAHQYSLTVNVSGSGAVSSNTVAIPSTSNGISACSAIGGTCTAKYAEGAQVILDGIVGWHVATASTDNCGGSLSAGVFTTAALSTQTCTASLTLAQDQATTSVSSDVNPSVYGNAVTFTATVSPSAPATAVPTGSVTFYDGGVPIAGCAGALSGLNPSTATCSVPVLAGGSHSITASYSGDTNYLAPQPGSTLLTQQVNAASQTITTFAATPASPTYSSGGTFTISATKGASSSPLAFASTSLSVCTVSGSTVSMLSAGTCALTADQAGDANYNAAAQVPLSVTIVKGSQTITNFATTPASPTYSSGGTFTVSATKGASSSPLAFASTSLSVCTVSGSTVSMLSAGTCALTADQAGDANYNAAAQVPLSVTIVKGSQTITNFAATPANPTYANGGTFTISATKGASSSALTFASTSFSVCTVSGSTVSMLSAGTCALTADQAGNANYNAAAQVPLNVTIAKATQTITNFAATPASPTYSSGGAFTVSATKGASSSALAFASTSFSVCTVSGSTVSMLSAGTCALTADQAGNANYNAAAQVPLSVMIVKATQTITFTSIAPTAATAGGTYVVTAEVASGLPVVLTIDASASSICSIDGSSSGSTVTYTGVGTCVIDANQSGDSSYNAAALEHQSFDVAPGTGAKLAFVQQPIDLQRGVIESVQVAVEDASGNRLSSDNSTNVSLAGPACGNPFTLATTTAVNGVATFNIRFYSLASISLTASSTSEASATSSNFNVTANDDLVFAAGMESCRP